MENRALTAEERAAWDYLVERMGDAPFPDEPDAMEAETSVYSDANAGAKLASMYAQECEHPLDQLRFRDLAERLERIAAKS